MVNIAVVDCVNEYRIVWVMVQFAWLDDAALEMVG